MKRRRALLLTTMLVLTLCAACGVGLRLQQQQYARNRDLIAALIHNDTRTALALAHAGADPNTRYFSTSAPTLYALQQRFQGHKRPPDDDGPTAFMLACGVGYSVPNGNFGFVLRIPDRVTLAQAMLAHGAELHTRYRGDFSVLMGALQVNDTALADLLLAHGANPNGEAGGGITPLMFVTMIHNPAMGRYLLAHGANPNAQDRNGNTALHYGVMANNNADCIRQLLAHGADPTLPNKYGVIPLTWAQQARRPDLARLLKRQTK